MGDLDIQNYQQFQRDNQDIEEVINIDRIRNRRAPKIYRKRTNVFADYSDAEFKQIYRMPKNLAERIILMVEERIDDVINIEEKRGSPVPIELQVLATLRYLAKGCYQREVADLHGISQPALSVIIGRIVRVLATYLPEYIRFPTEREELRTMKQKFFRVAGMPGIVGAIDCTHIKIKNPGGEHPALYINRKGFFSINVQIVCDADCRIMDIVARWRGSAHDSRIWDACSLKRKFQDGTIDGILVGDGGYAASSFLLTPLLNPNGPREERYNAAHIRTRNCIERLFGQWKSKYRCLFNCLNTNLDTAKTTVIAAAVLYNIYLDHKLENNGKYLN